MNGINGISGLDKLQNTQEQYDALGNSILEEQSQQLSTQLQVFQNALMNYSNQHSKEIMENPKFRSEFSKICLGFGVGLENNGSASGSGTGTGKGNSNAIASGNNTNDEKDQFYFHRLAINIIEICHQTKDQNGGIISIQDELINILRDNNNFPNTTIQEIEQAIENLTVLGDELKIVTIGSKKFLKSIPQELNQDENVILETCNLIGGYISESILRANFNWDKIRCKQVLQDMVSNGLLWIDTQDKNEQITYWTSFALNQ